MDFQTYSSRGHSVNVIPVHAEKKFGKFDLAKTVIGELRSEKIILLDGDIVVVSSKFAAMAEERCVELAKVNADRRAVELAKTYSIDPPLAQLILEESEVILGGIPGFVLSVSRGILAPNAGIDRSNVPPGYAILYPKNPERVARKLRFSLIREFCSSIEEQKRLKLGVVLSDSRITPTRLGTIGIAIAAVGFAPVMDFRGVSDLFGNKLKVTIRAVADELASAAQLVMGEAAESVPIVVIRGFEADFQTKKGGDDSLSMLIPHEKCLYIQGLKNSLLSGSTII